MAGLLRILIIQKESDYKLVAEALQRAGLNIKSHWVDNLRYFHKAIELYQWDLILSSHQLTDCLPEEALKLTADANLDIPFILVTPTISKDKLSSLFRAGAHAHIDIHNLYLLPPIIERELSEASNRKKQAKNYKNLYKSANNFRTLLENTPIPLLLLSNQHITYLNQAAKKLLQFRDDVPFSEIEAEEIFIAPPEALTSPHLNSLQQTSKPIQSTFRRQDGQEFQVEAWSSRTYHLGRPATQIIFHDITNRIADEFKLKQAANVYEYTTEGVVVMDKDANVIAVNPAFSKITGYSEHEVLGKNPGFLNSEKHTKTFYAELWETLEQKNSWQGEIWNRRKNGEVYTEWLTITSVLDDQGNTTQYVAVFSDITSIKQSQSQLEHLAHHDPLTDLPNRLLFEDRLEHAIASAKRENGHLAVMFLDLDRFKNINDSLGHTVGDALLVQVAKRLRSLLRENDTAARLGGDEFTILVENLKDPSYSAVIATKIQNQFKQPFDIFGRKLHVTASIGISLYPEDGRNVGNLTKNADAAMYQAKESGRNSYRFYTAELTQSAFERLLLETELRNAIKDDQLLLYYQPQFSIESESMTGAEALLRWRHPRMGIIPPAKFIPLAEETGLIHEIGHWALQQACEQTRRWSQMGLFTGRMAVNLSVRQIMQSDLILRFEEIIEKTNCPPKHLQFEVTEGIFMDQKELSVPVLNVFKQLGVSIAIDDFGTGYSSLSYLKHLPIDKLKIDRSFIQNMPDDQDDIAIVQAIISLGETLGLDIIAEGVETEAQQNMLKTMGCQEAQGYFYGAPMSVESFNKKLTSICEQPSQAISFFNGN
ncbi:MAG: EAL domain-containing protein [Pseudomonadota bacterium]